MKNRIFLILLLILCNGNVKAQSIMTLEKCREIALEKNKAASIAGRMQEQAGYESNSYKAKFLPKISASGMYLYTNTEMDMSIPGGYLPTYVPDGSGQLVPNILSTMPDGSPIFKEYAYFPGIPLNFKLSNTYEASIRAEQPIYTGGKITSAYKMSKLGKDIAELNQHLTRTEIIVQTDEAYWTHVKANELLKLAESYKKVVKELYKNVQDAHESGLKPKNDVLKVQVQVNRAELQCHQAENAVRLSRMNLCHVMGIPLTSEVVVSSSFDETPVEILYTTDYTTRPEYSILEKQIKLKEQQIKLVRSDYLPNVGLMANYGYSHGLSLNDSPLLDRAAFSALLSVNIPIFQWGEGQNKVRAAKAEKQIVQLQRDDIGEKMELELMKALDKCNESVLEVRLTTRSLEQAEENMKVSHDQYDAGMETLANYLEAQTMWQQAWLELINAKANLRFNETYYLKAAGKL